MIQIIPAILEKEFSEAALKLRRLEKEAPDTRLLQIDIADGVFVPNVTWSRAGDLAGFTASLTYEIHLMVREPSRILEEWLALSSLRRIIIHKEACSEEKIAECASRVHNAGKEIGAALNPDTALDEVISSIPRIDMILFMGVVPGFAGQSFKKEVLEKIRALRLYAPALPISVDGGVNRETAPEIVAAGATHLCTGSYLWKQKNVGEAIAKLKKVIYIENDQ